MNPVDGLLAVADVRSWFEALSDPIALAVLLAASIAGAWLVATVGVGVANAESAPREPETARPQEEADD